MDLVDALVLKSIKGVGDDTLAKLLEFLYSNGLNRLEDLSKVERSRLPLSKVPPALSDFLRLGQFEQSRSDYRAKLAEWRKQGIEVLLYGATEYPSQLKHLLKPPQILFCKGNIDLLKRPKVIAVVGTRENTRKGEQIAKKTVEYFSKHGFIIVSGLALGIDTIAHRAAIEFRAPTVAVLVDLLTISPSSNRGLADDILKHGGLWVAENPPGTKAIPAFFAKRDRIQAGLSSAVFAIETAIDGGTMHAVNASKSMKRPVYVPNATAAGYSDLGIRAISGTQQLAKDGLAIPYTRDSYAKITRDLEDLSASFGKPSSDEQLV